MTTPAVAVSPPVTPIPAPAPTPAQATVAAAPAPVVQLRVTPEQAAELHRHIPFFAARVHEATRSNHPAEVVIDLTGVTPGPFYAELACLCEVLRRVVGQHTQITLRNVNPAVAISLQAGYLPEEVRIIPTRRRRSHWGPSSPRDGPGAWPAQRAGSLLCPPTSTMSSTSTGAPSGNSATPTAERACRPALPNTSVSSSEAPLSTAACAVKPGAEATNPTTFTTRATASRPTRSATAASALSAHVRAS